MSNLLNNPMQNLAFGPLVLMLGLLFVGAGLALAMVDFNRRLPAVSRFWFLDYRFWLVDYSRRESHSVTDSSILWQRYRTWLIIAVAYVGCAMAGPLAIALLCAFLCWQGGREYAKLMGLPTLHFGFLIAGGWLTLAGTLFFGSTALQYAPTLAFFGWAILLGSNFSPKFALRTEISSQGQPVGQNLTLSGSGYNPQSVKLNAIFKLMLGGMWGYLYLGWLPAHLIGLAAGKMPNLVLLIGLGVALSDVGAFCAGKALGGPKLAPILSPNKTWGGVAGNFAGAVLAILLLGFALPGLQWWQAVLLTLAIGLGSIWGDLLESLLKRQSGVKDAGKWLPGFGGLLDRIDSFLLVVPLVYYLSQLVF